ncbi:DUF4157 domain-containing protein [Cellvibrio japonicus]|nr:DUF4157 domain-containing protein [Cellvibrio japonicus]QEI17821.1 DUF4157 domain-containing protein [Cellvibrio japonicus]QEI21396.1 DUF4157 domain-containing protein [Cellvibrio japonicus]
MQESALVQCKASGYVTNIIQRVEEDDEPWQGKMKSGRGQSLAQIQVANNTGLPSQLKAGVESLSGMSFDHVKVHYNSAKPAQLNAHAYAQGSDIHLGPGQEQHLPHEAWHLVQQAQGRVKPTTQLQAGIPVNDDVHLEQEADTMGARAQSMGQQAVAQKSSRGLSTPSSTIQMAKIIQLATRSGTFNPNAAKAPTNAAMPGMQAPAYGGVSANNTGLLGGRNGIHNPAYGSGVGGIRPPQWANLVNLTGGNPWVQLHLLNDNLGGQGQATNLAPGSRSFNSQHLHGAEKPVKNWAGHSGAAQAANKAADYQVTAQYNTPGPVITELHQMYDQTHNMQQMIANRRGQLYSLSYQNLYNTNQAFQNLVDTDNQAQTNYQLVMNFINAAYFQHLALGYAPQFFVPPIQVPNPPVRSAQLVQIENLLDQFALNQAIQDVQAEITSDKQWISNYVAASFPSSFTCSAIFYEENPVGSGTIVATAPQQITISY